MTNSELIKLIRVVTTEEADQLLFDKDNLWLKVVDTAYNKGLSDASS